MSPDRGNRLLAGALDDRMRDCQDAAFAASICDEKAEALEDLAGFSAVRPFHRLTCKLRARRLRAAAQELDRITRIGLVRVSLAADDPGAPARWWRGPRP